MVAEYSAPRLESSNACCMGADAPEVRRLLSRLRETDSNVSYSCVSIGQGGTVISLVRYETLILN